jgi:Vitamin K-dependent gamma-carboxylase
VSVRAAVDAVLTRCDRFWYMPAPAARLAVLRALVGAYALVYLCIRTPSLLSVIHFVSSDFEPVGPVRVLSQPLASGVVYTTVIVALLSGAGFFAGALYRLTGPVFALSFLWVTSYRSSFGMVFHTENMTALHLLLLAAAPAADTLSIDARRRTSARPDSAATKMSGRYGWAVRAICAVTVTTYVLAGIAKLRLAGAHWLDGDLLRGQVAYDNLRKIELGSFHSPLGALLVRYSWPFRTLSWASLVLELGAPLALFSFALARVWVFGVFGFHLGVLALMAIGFPYQLSFIPYLAFFPVEALAPYLRRFAPRLFA